MELITERKIKHVLYLCVWNYINVFNKQHYAEKLSNEKLLNVCLVYALNKYNPCGVRN